MIYVAPGKVVLVGEYAVLDGGPAVAAAVNRGVSCTVSPSDRIAIETPGDDRFARAALEHVGAPPAKYTFAAWNDPGTTTKAGLGGSAAATVVAVLAGSGGGLDPEDLRRTADTVHRRIQGGGSGVDIAAAAYGGVLRFEAGRCQPLPPVHPVVVWSGTSAQTGPRVRQYLALPDREAFVDASREIADGFTASPLTAMRAACGLLDRVIEGGGISWWTPALREIVALAEASGGAAKPSGAGGGDCAVALFESEEDAGHFRRACTAAGYTVIPTSLAPGAGRL